jgi:hypothetical protein
MEIQDTINSDYKNSSNNEDINALDLINRKILTALNDFLNLHYLKNLDTFD